MSKKLIFSSISALLLIGIISFGVFSMVSAQANKKSTQDGGGDTTSLTGDTNGISAPGAHALKGYAWSSNIGWIHFNPNGGGVFMDGTTGNLSGYAWSNTRDDVGQSDNIGWLSFTDTSGCPSTPCQPRIDPSSGTITGWARFRVAIDESSNSGDWDGWVHLSDPNPSPKYTSSVNISTNNFTPGSYFWGGGTSNPTGTSTPGWIHLCGTGYCVSVDTATTTLPIKPGKPGDPTQTNAGACDSTGGSVSMSWLAGNPAPTTGGYYVYRTDISGNIISKSFSASTNTTVTYGLNPDTVYYFKITAFNAGAGQIAESDPSAVVAMRSSKNTCQAAAITFKATPSTVPAGGICNLAWTVTFPGNCTITSTGDKKFPFSFVSPNGTNTSSPTVGTATTSPIYRSFNYTLTCGTLSAKTSCAVAPKFIEF